MGETFLKRPKFPNGKVLLRKRSEVINDSLSFPMSIRKTEGFRIDVSKDSVLRFDWRNVET